MPADGESWVPTTFRALRHRNYRLYFFGQLVSLIGTWVQTTALMWLAFQWTGRSEWNALIQAAQIYPTFFLGILGGSVADRWPKRSVIFCTQAILLALALLLGALVLTGWRNEWYLLAIAGAGGVTAAVDLPARLAFVVDMVGREDLVNAVALNALVFNVARLLGPFVGGQLLAWLDAGPCFLVNGLSYVAVLTALASMRLIESTLPVQQPKRGSLGESMRYILARYGLLLLLLMAGAVALTGWPFLVLLPALAERRLGQPEVGYSIMLSGTGGGALVAALLIATYGSLERRRLFLAAGVLAVLAGLLGLADADKLLPAAAYCALLGCGMVLFLSTGQAVVQLTADDRNRARLMGVWSMILCGAQPTGSLLAGRAADLWGEAAALRGQALACSAAATATALALGVRAWLRER